MLNSTMKGRLWMISKRKINSFRNWNPKED